jgi:hypothetical protein
VAAGCGTTTLHRGRVPTWALPAFSLSGTKSTQWPYVMAHHGTAMAVVFGFPLHAGEPTNPRNKVLWVMRLPRNGSSLAISAHRLGGNARSVHSSWPPDSSPGEIYPSYVDVPRAGCWRVTLHWAHHTDSVDLGYVN